MITRKNSSLELFIMALATLVSGNSFTKKYELHQAAFSGFMPKSGPIEYEWAVKSRICTAHRLRIVRAPARFRPCHLVMMDSKITGAGAIKSQQLAARLKLLKVGELRDLFNQVGHVYCCV